MKEYTKATIAAGIFHHSKSAHVLKNTKCFHLSKTAFSDNSLFC
jgi:hypothetical protein